MRFGAKRFVRGTSGQSLVEFALILPMMLVVMFMITEFGRALFQYNVLTTATREAVRQGAVANATNWTDKAKAVSDSILTAGHIDPATVQFNPTDVANYNGSTYHLLGVQLTKQFTWAFKGPMTMQGGGTVNQPGALQLKAETFMKSETF